MRLLSIRLLLFWVLSIVAPLGVAETQTVNVRQAAAGIHLRELESECIPQRVGGCDLTISTMRSVTLHDRERISDGVRVHFSAGGGLAIAGGSLDFGGATVDAPASQRVFFGEGRVLGLALSRPEWFAEARGGVYPREALLAAYIATRGKGTILLEDRAYLSPFFDPHSPGTCGGKTVAVDSLNVSGAHRPVPDRPNDPMRLVNGAVILGEICGTGPVHLQHVGVDVGPFVVKENFDGIGTFGIALLGGPSLGAVTGTSLFDVSVLTTGMKDQHSVIIEGQRAARVKDLWIWTRGGTHGLVMKSFASTVENLHCSGAAATCLILKSDYVTDHGGVASDTHVDGVYLHWLQKPGDTAGIELNGQWDSLERIQLKNIHEEGLTYGVAVNHSILYGVSQVALEDWHAADMRGPCLVLSGDHVRVEDFSCVQGDHTPGAAMILDGSDISLRRGLLGCVGGGCGSSTNDGVVDLGRRNRVEEVVGVALGGYLVRTSVKRGGTRVEGLDATRMEGRTAVVNVVRRVSLREWVMNAAIETKHLLRICFTRLTTEVQGLVGRLRGAWAGSRAVSVASLSVFVREEPDSMRVFFERWCDEKNA